MNNNLTNKPYIPSGFKYWKQGWYFEFNKPEDSIQVPQAEYEELIAGQAKGQQIQENDSGYPILIGSILTDEQQQANAAKAQEISLKRTRLKALSEDLIQALAGENVPNILERKQEFITLHNELRKLEGKEPRTINEII